MTKYWLSTEQNYVCCRVTEKQSYYAI